ncbi:MAG: hypothetical protein AAGC68_05895, partial [Verrucomicrobiota bacterium]
MNSSHFGMLRFHVTSLALIISLGSSLAIAQVSEAPRLSIDSRGHGSNVNSLHYTPDGSRLITSADDKVVRVWNIATEQIETTFRHRQGDNFEGAVAPIAMSPDGRFLTLSVGTYEQSDSMFDVRIIDRRFGKITALLRGHQAAVLTAAFSGDGQWLFTGDMAGQIRVWKTSSIPIEAPASPLLVTDSVHLVGHTGGLLMVRTTHDGTILVSTDANGQGFLWQRQPDGFFQGLGDLGANSGNVAATTISHDGRFIAAAGKDGLTYVFEGTGNPLGILDQNDPGIKSCLEFSPNGSRLAIGVIRDAPSGGCSVDIYDLPGGVRSVSFREQPSGTSALDWSPDGTTIASAGGDNHDIEIWDTVSGGGDSQRIIGGQGNGLWAVAIQQGESGPRIAFGNINDHRDDTHDTALDNPLTHLFDFASMTLEEVADPAKFAEFQRAVVSAEGSNLLYANPTQLSVGGSPVTLADASRGDSIRSFSFTPDGNLIIGSQYLLTLFRPNGQTLINFNE